MAVLLSPQSLPMGVPLISPNGKYALLLRDGVLVGYAKDGTVFWSTAGPSFQGPAPYRLAMQANGNLVVYDAADNPVWATYTQRLNEPGQYSLVMQDDRNIVVYNSLQLTVAWESKTRVQQVEPIQRLHQWAEVEPGAVGHPRLVNGLDRSVFGLPLSLSLSPSFQTYPSWKHPL